MCIKLQHHKKHFNARVMLLRGQEGVDHDAFDFEDAYNKMAKEVSVLSLDYIVRWKVYSFT